ncbi:MAG: 5-formyltetrahydrofolate cyclo-ligase [Pirellulales bacterium]|nr:5-formyltetrahydrofolate cyclo-ligase [Pirellulales bacterium]
MGKYSDPRTSKQEVRRQALAACADLADKDERSRVIWAKFLGLEEYRRAATVMCYVHVRDEVRTREFLPTVLGHGKTLVVPYCDGDELGLFRLENAGELSPGTLGILEPAKTLRESAGKRIDVSQLDLVMVPGAAFDRRGGRVGHGKGYYDRLLRRTRPDARRIAVAFECQVFPSVPMLEHDTFVDAVLTEVAMHQAGGRDEG